LANKQSQIIKFLKDKKAIGLAPMWRNMLLVSLFVLCLILFTSAFLNANNPNSDILTNTSFVNVETNLNSTLSAVHPLVDQNYTSFRTSKASITSIFLILDVFLTLPFSLASILLSTYQILADAVFGWILGPQYSIVYDILLGILIGSLIFAITKFIRIGEPER
jgi:hypothetical protein